MTLIGLAIIMTASVAGTLLIVKIVNGDNKLA